MINVFYLVLSLLGAATVFVVLEVIIDQRIGYRVSPDTTKRAAITHDVMMMIKGVAFLAIAYYFTGP